MVRIAVRDGGGKRQNRTIGTYRTKREAEKAERDALSLLERGTLLDPEQTTIAELLDTWLGSKKGSISANSIQDYESACRLHIKPAIGKIKVQKITPERLQSEYTKWQEGGMSARMVHRCHIVLSQALAQAVRFGMVHRNIALDVTKPSLNRGKHSVWTPEEVRAFLRAADNRPILVRTGKEAYDKEFKTRPDDLTPLWHFLVLEGMRRGEALGLRWADVNWARNVVHISQTVAPDKSDRGKAIVQQRTKTNAGARTVKLSRQTIEALTAHRDRQRFVRQAAGESWIDHDLIVSTALGAPVNPTNVSRSFHRLVQQANLPRIRVHDLRHSSATLLLRQGVPAKIVSERLGHAGVGITMDLYSHVTPDMQDLAAEAMSALMDESLNA
jgi:integrase